MPRVPARKWKPAQETGRTLDAEGLDRPGGAREAQAPLADAPVTARPGELQVEGVIEEIEGEGRERGGGEVQVPVDAVGILHGLTCGPDLEPVILLGEIERREGLGVHHVQKAFELETVGARGPQAAQDPDLAHDGEVDHALPGKGRRGCLIPPRSPGMPPARPLSGSASPSRRECRAPRG